VKPRWKLVLRDALEPSAKTIRVLAACRAGDPAADLFCFLATKVLRSGRPVSTGLFLRGAAVDRLIAFLKAWRAPQEGQ